MLRIFDAAIWLRPASVPVVGARALWRSWTTTRLLYSISPDGPPNASDDSLGVRRPGRAGRRVDAPRRSGRHHPRASSRPRCHALDADHADQCLLTLVRLLPDVL